MKLIVESSLTGPLACSQTLAALERAAASAASLDEADQLVSRIPALATYRGGSHVAVHPTWNGHFSNGSERLALIVEDAA